MKTEEIFINKYLPIAVIYFFLNGLFLPLGLLYTTLLTPIFLIWLARYPIIKYVAWYFVFIAPFVVVHFINGVDSWYYLKSFVLLFSVFVFCLAFWQFLENCRSLKAIYKDLLVMNAVMVMVCLLFLFIPSMRDIFWNDNPMSLTSVKIQRLKMFTYEPSYYSTLFAPLAIYFLLKVFRKESGQPLLYLVLVLVPLFLSLSFGVILAIGLSLLVVVLLYSRKILFKATNLKYAIATIMVAGTAIIILLIFFPENVFFKRLIHVFEGKDLSFNGRTYDSFFLGNKIAREKSFWFGSGLGQVKVLGLEFFKDFYNNPRFEISDVSIPNNVGDILATFGLVGVLIKFFFEVYFYFKTRVSLNYYRLALFLFIFIYQFTGSFIMNIAEYAIWILAFKQNIFPEFNRPVATSLKQKQSA